MELTGSLKKFPVTKVLQFLNMDTASGLLTVKRGKHKVGIVLLEGNILDVEDSEETKEQRMRKKLLTSNRLSESELGIYQEEKKSRLIPLGKILEERGYLTKDEHERMIKTIYSDILFGVLEWKDGVYDFERKDEVIATDLEKTLSVNSIMLNAARQEDEWPTVRRYVPTMRAVFHISGTQSQEAWETVVNNLGPDELRIVNAVDGVSTVKMIADSLFMREFEVAHVIAEMVKRGMVARSYEQEALYSQPSAKGLFSSGLGRMALIPLKLVAVALLALFVWVNYISPVLVNPERSLSPVINAGRDDETLNRLRLLRLQKAFYNYLKEQGALPTSLAVLVRLNYCTEEDLKSIDGGYFVLKVLGDQEETAMIQATDEAGNPRPELSTEISIN